MNTIDKRKLLIFLGLFTCISILTLILLQARIGLEGSVNTIESSKESGEVLKNLQDPTAIIPFEFKYSPVKKLALVNFEKNPDSLYNALELQYLDDKVYGEGYRVIAYRCDGFVDVYDDIALKHNADEDFNVAGKGLGEKNKVLFKDTVFEIENGNLSLSFSFIDKERREIAVKILEKTSKTTKNIDLLAPVGYSSENPSFLPLYFLYDFDFVRKAKTDVEITIGGKKIAPDSFPVPVPKDFQYRFYARYTTNCLMVEMANASNTLLKEHLIPDENIIVYNSTEYHYSGDILMKMELNYPYHFLSLEFENGFPNMKTMYDGEIYTDKFKIIPGGEVGFISGTYSLARNGDNIRLELSPSDGWSPVTKSLLTKMMLGKKSIFRIWPKTYRYVQKIDLTTLESESFWERTELKK